MGDMIATIGRPRVEVVFGENTSEAMRQAALAGAEKVAAAGFAAASATSAAFAETIAGPTYASTGAGLAATTDGETFAVDNGDGTVTIFLNDGGSAVYQRRLATTEALGSSTGGELVGFRQRTIFDRLADVVNLLDEGVVADDTAPCAALINAAADKARSEGKGLVLPRCALPVYIDESVDLTGIRSIRFETPLRVDESISEIPIVAGGFASGDLCDWWFDDVTDGTPVASTAPPPRPIMRIVGLKGSQVRLGSCNYLQLYADLDAGADYDSTAYNRFFFDGLISLLHLTDSGDLSWVTENQIFASRIDRLRIEGNGYPHNHNLISRSTFEGPQFAAEFINCSHNKVTSARGEGIDASPGITFDEQSYSNVVSFGWSGTGNPRNDFVIPCPVNDLGMGNLVTTEAAQTREKVAIATAGPMSGIVGNASASVAICASVSPFNPGLDNFTDTIVLTPSLGGFEVGSFRYAILTPPIPVHRGDVFVWEADYDGSIARTATFVLDEHQRPLIDEGGGLAFVDQPSATFSTAYGRYALSGDLDADTLRQSPITVVRDEVKYVRLAFFSGTGGFFRSASVSTFVNPLGRAKTLAAENPTGLRSLAGAPTKGFVPAGSMLFDRTAEIMRYVTLEYESQTTGALVATNTSVTIAAAGSILDGDLVGILLDNGKTHWSTVSGLTGATFTVAALPSAAASGARVVFNRWAS